MGIHSQDGGFKRGGTVSRARRWTSSIRCVTRLTRFRSELRVACDGFVHVIMRLYESRRLLVVVRVCCPLDLYDSLRSRCPMVGVEDLPRGNVVWKEIEKAG